MDQTLLKYWKTCLQDAERKAIALKGPRITLNIGDKILKFIPLKNIPVIFTYFLIFVNYSITQT